MVRAPQLARDMIKPRPDRVEECRPVDRAVKIPLLLFKMHDEISEISRDLTNPEEYADLFESMLSLAEANGLTFGDIWRARQAKMLKKGRLCEGNLWVPAEFMETKNDREAA